MATSTKLDPLTCRPFALQDTIRHKPILAISIYRMISFTHGQASQCNSFLNLIGKIKIAGNTTVHHIEAIKPHIIGQDPDLSEIDGAILKRPI